MLTHSGPGARLQIRPKLSTIVYLRAFVLLCTTQARNVDTFNLPVINHRKRVVVGGGRDRSGKRRMFSLFLHSEPFRVVRRCVCVCVCVSGTIYIIRTRSAFAPVREDCKSPRLRHNGAAGGDPKPGLSQVGDPFELLMCV